MIEKPEPAGVPVKSPLYKKNACECRQQISSGNKRKLFGRLQDQNKNTVSQEYQIQKYIRFEDGNIILGEAGNELTLRIENDRISFLDDGAEVAYLSNKKLVVLDGWFIHSLRVGAFAALPRGNGNLSIVKVVE